MDVLRSIVCVSHNMNVTHRHTLKCSSLVKSTEEAHVIKGIWIQTTKIPQNSGLVILVRFGLGFLGFFYCQSVYSDPSGQVIVSLMSRVPQSE